jgi:hypothetical protein
MKSKKDLAESTLKSLLNSTPTDTSQSEPTKMSNSINPFPNNNSKLKSPESEGSDLIHSLFTFHSFKSQAIRKFGIFWWSESQ